MNRRKEGKRRGKKGKEEGKEGSKRKGGKEEGKGREERRRERRKKREAGTEGHAVSRRAGCPSGSLASLPVGPGLGPPSPRPLRHRGAGRLRRASRRASVPCRADGFVPPGSCQVSASCCYFVLLERDWCCFPERPY